MTYTPDKQEAFALTLKELPIRYVKREKEKPAMRLVVRMFGENNSRVQKKVKA